MMDEVIALENQIRAALAEGRPNSPGLMVADGVAILRGLPTRCAGTRLERLRVIAAALKQFTEETAK